MRSKAIIGLTITTTAYVALIVLDQQTGTLRAATTPTTIVWLSVAFFGFMIAVWANERNPLSARWIWGAAIGFRLLMLATEPTLSDDVFRYLWDGHVLTEGVNPYTHPISAAALDPYEVAVRRLANNPHLASPYLPTAQLIFAAIAALLPLKALSVQLVMALFDLATAGVIAKLLARGGFAAHRVLLYLWHPLVVVELSHGAHLDGAMTFFAVAALATSVGAENRTAVAQMASQQQPSWRQWLSPILLSMSVLTRPIPALLAPVLWWRWRWSQRFMFGLSMLVFLVPFSFGGAGLGLAPDSVGTGVFGSARVYASDFRFNGGLAHWMSDLAGENSGAPTVVVTIVMATTGFVVWRLAKPTTGATSSYTSSDVSTQDLVRHLRLGAVLLMAYTILTPVFHPWYLVILLAFLPFLTPRSGERSIQWMSITPWLLLSATLPLSYLTYVDPNAFGEKEWVRLAEWAPTLVLAAATGLLAWLHRSAGTHHEL